MREEFEQWLKQEKYAISTITQYCSAISYISVHYSEQNNKHIDLYEINNIDSINKLVEKYGTSGEYKEIGNMRNGGIRAAINAYARFLEQKESEPELTSTPLTEDKLEVLDRAFKLILPVLSRYICNILIEKDKNNWWRKYVLGKLKDVNTLRKLPKESSDDDYIESLDIPACLNIIECNWLDVFRDKMDDRQRTWAHVLHDIRNYYQAHFNTKTIKNSSIDDISLELAIMLRFMRPIDTYVADRISEMKKVFENKYRDDNGIIINYRPKLPKSKDYALYIFNDEILNKRQLVLAVIRNYVKDKPNVTLNDLQHIFVKKINGPYNIVDSYDNANKKYPTRYFLDEIINLDQRIVVCNQWGKDNIPQFLQKANELGYNITKKED